MNVVNFVNLHFSTPALSNYTELNLYIIIYNLGKSDTIGRYMVAKRDINPGEVIFTDQPAVIG